MDKIVLDTSVIIKWFSLEPGRKDALGIRDRVVQGKTDLVEPDLIFYELINALWFGKKFGSKKIGRILTEFRNLDPEIVALNPELTAIILKLINKFSITTYDASFVALANENKIPLITADTKHHKKAYGKFIIPLAEFSTPG